MKKHWITPLVLIAMLQATQLHGQASDNMVFNPSFEEHRDCPVKLDALGVMREADAWWQPTRCSSYYFHA